VAEHTAGLHAGNDQVESLRRVATLVAKGVPSAEIFSAVSEEVGRLFGADISAIVRFEQDGAAAVMGVHGGPHARGARVELEPDYVVASVRRGARAARFDTDEPGAAGMPELVRNLGIRSGVASPIVVDGELWGAITLASLSRSFPTWTEVRLAEFTELVATALVNTQARDILASLADEQAGLRRVATLVAQGASPDELFVAVSNEVATLFGAEIATIGRFERTEPPEITAVGVSEGSNDFLIGIRSPLMDWLASTHVYRTGRTARKELTAEQIADPGTLADAVRAMGFFSTVSAPIVVEGELWGVVTASSSRERLPADTEKRIESFSELVATAIANAESRSELATSEARARALAEEQAALRRVATLVACEPASEELFSTVAREVATVLNVPGVLVDRFETDGTNVTFGVAYDLDLTGAESFFGSGTRMPLDPGSLAAQVFESHRTARVTDYSQLPGTIGDAARAAGLGSGVASPILVDGELWGQMCVFSRAGAVLPIGTEHRVHEFVELVATAISNYEAHAALQRLADEQAALRRVATLVAGGVDPAEVFAAVSDEVSRLLGAEQAAVGRFAVDGGALFVVGASEGYRGPMGARVEFADYLSSAEVFRTGRPARKDLRADQVIGSESVADALRSWGFFSTVSAPIVVEGSLWGVLNVLLGGERLPPDTEERLGKFAELVATAIANAESRSELSASRRRIVAASDEARRRIERDLHDGTQQRLVSLGLEVRATEADLSSEQSDLRADLSRIATGLGDAVMELQEISRGIHPAILAQGGLGPALRTLARRSVIPVVLDITTDARTPAPVEIAAYYVASEALANAAKYAQASRIDVSLARRDSMLLLEIRDDGVGGADPAGGSGLVGLLDRVEALGGSIHLESTNGAGTRIAVELPVELAGS